MLNKYALLVHQLLQVPPHVLLFLTQQCQMCYDGVFYFRNEPDQVWPLRDQHVPPRSWPCLPSQPDCQLPGNFKRWYGK